MPLTVLALGAYASYSRDDIPWRNDDYNVNKFIKALKRKPFAGHGSLPKAGGGRRQFTQASPINASISFAEWGAARLRDLELGPVALVPVPSSVCVTFDMDTAPARMCMYLQALSRKQQTSVGKWLRFSTVMASASAAGGTRNEDVLVSALVVGDCVAGSKAVLVDDVKTTGSHLRACARVLRSAGVEVEVALVGATTVWHQHPNPLQLDPEELEFPIWPAYLR